MAFQPAAACRIGFVSAELLPVTRGGAGVLLARAAAELLRRGHDVHVLLDAPAEAARTFRRCHQHALPGPGRFHLLAMEELPQARQFDPNAVEGPANWYQRKSRQWYLAIDAWLARTPLDVVELPDFYGFGHAAAAAHRWLGHWSAMRLVVRAHTTMESLQQTEIGGYVNRDALLMHEQERACLADADAVLVPSPCFGRWMSARYGLDERRVHVSRPPLEDAPPSAAPVDAVRDTVLFVGRLFHVKGADTFVDAAVRLLERDAGRRLDPAVRFVLLGYDSNMGPGLTSFEQHLRRRIPPRLAGRFLFPGQVPPEQVDAWYARALCYVCPSRMESFGYTVHEAAERAVPLVLNDLPAFEDFFRDGEDCLKFDGSAASLARALERLLGEEPLRRRLGRVQRPADEPLGQAYELLARQARARPPVAQDVPHDGSDVLAVVLAEGDETPPSPLPTAQEAIRLAWPAARVVHARAIDVDADARRTMNLLGRHWAVDAEPVTGEMLLLCLAGDRFDPEYLRQAAATLRRREGLGFVAPWAEPPGATANFMPAPLELELPLWPLERKQALTRCLLRTEPGLWLADLFDRRVEAFGEIACLWGLQEAHLAGLQWPQPCAALARSSLVPEDRMILQSLLLRSQQPRRAKLLMRLAGQLANPPPASLPVELPPPSPRRRLARRLKRLVCRSRP